MKNLILISHGLFCEELRKSTEMIMGPQESIQTVALLPNEGPEEFKAKFLAVTSDLSDYIVFADLMGGTPCNVVSKLILAGEEIELYAGMNMPMIIGFINEQLTGESVDLIQTGISNITHINQILLEDLDEEDE